MKSSGAIAQNGLDRTGPKWFHSLKLPWPEGTAIFAFKTWLALAIGFYGAFFLQLEGALTCGVTILILAHPTQGMVFSKAVYRTAGTLVGVAAAIFFTAVFAQDRTMLIASFAVWVGVMTAVATLLRDFRAYACVLAGYTVALVSLLNIDSPDVTFEAAINRVAALLVGVVAIALANLLLYGQQASQSLSHKLRAGTLEVIKMAHVALDERCRPPPESCIDMAARFMPLRSEISFASPERPNGRARAASARSALLGLFEAISAIQAVGIGLAQATQLSAGVVAAVDLTRKAINLQNPERCLPAFETLTLETLKTGEMQVGDAHIFDRLHFLIVTLADVRDGLRGLRLGRWPRRLVDLPVHQDYVAVVLNAVRVIVSVAIVASLSVWSGIPDTAEAVLFTGVFVSLGSLQPNPDTMGNAGLFGMPIALVFSVIYAFFVFPNITGYPLFIISLAPLVIITCWLIITGKPGYGLIIGVVTLTQISPNNLQVLDPTSFVATAAVLIPAGLAIFVAFRLVLPVQPAQRRLRLALGVGSSLRHAIRDKNRRKQPRASLQYDRLCQFKTWQRNQAPTVARHKTMTRLVDLGLLAYAVRRSWRALDRAQPNVPPELDAQARRILPTLAFDELDQVAQNYIALAPTQDDAAALALIHATAALHGAAVATNIEQRLLRHAALLKRSTGRNDP